MLWYFLFVCLYVFFNWKKLLAAVEYSCANYRACLLSRLIRTCSRTPVEAPSAHKERKHQVRRENVETVLMSNVEANSTRENETPSCYGIMPRPRFLALSLTLLHAEMILLWLLLNAASDSRRQSQGEKKKYFGCEKEKAAAAVYRKKPLESLDK